MWTLVKTEEYARRHKRYEKDHPRELQAVLDNLDTYSLTLASGVKPLQIQHGFLHREPQGVVAIDQKGGGKNLTQTRLYVYPDTDTETLYLVTLGDKRSQKTNLDHCRAIVAALRERQETETDEEADEDAVS